MKRAIYAGTFDPVTNGHLDIMQRAISIFDELVIAVALNRQKNTEFDLDNRVDMIRFELEENPIFKDQNVIVEPFDELLINFAEAKGINILIRGVRAISDFEYEFQMSCMNQRMKNDIQTIFLPASEKTQFISSNFVKTIARLKGDISSLVPVNVKNICQNKFN